ncbi:MAG TPA: cupin domain-containing protein [Myxococcota bacterium]
MTLEHWDLAALGPLTESALRRRLEQMGYRVACYVYPPGTRFGEHTHSTDKISAVLCGRLRVLLEEQQIILGPGDCVAVPRGAVHSVQVIGRAPVISLDATKP